MDPHNFKDVKENVIEALISGERRKQIVNFPTNKSNQNILDVIVVPEEAEAECKVIISPERTENRAGTNHEWLACRIKYNSERKSFKVNDDMETSDVKRVINLNIVCKFMENYEWGIVLEEGDDETYTHRDETCIAYNVQGSIKVKRNQELKETRINGSIKKHAEIVRVLKITAKTKPTQANGDEWKHQNNILNCISDIQVKENGKSFVQKLDRDKLAICRPINNQNKAKIRCLDDEEGNRVMDPKGVGEILSQHLSEKVFKRSDPSRNQSKGQEAE